MGIIINHFLENISNISSFENQNNMEYEVKYKLNGTVGVYYINFSNNNLQMRDIKYSIKVELAKYLKCNIEMDKLEILSINKIS